MPYPPAYEEWGNQPKPKINWDTPDGNWVGIWRGDWADLIGTEILKIKNDIDYQVWQTDYRADKVYSHTFDCKLKRCLFPALKIDNEAISPLMNLELIKISKESAILIIMPPPYYGMALKLLMSLNKMKNVKIICAWAGEFDFPIFRLFRLHRKVSQYFKILVKHIKGKIVFSKIDGVIYINNKNISSLKRYFKGPAALIPMGVDFTFWQTGCKSAARNKLNLPEHKKIILSSSRLVDLKQVDKLIDALKKLPDSAEYLLVITGHGTRSYENYLKEKARKLIVSEKLIFTGYVADDQLLLYYQAADLFLLTSISEGSPVNVQKALACKLPVMTTAVGFTAELLINNNAGVILPIKKYRQWTKELQKFINGTEIRILDRKIAEQNFAWPNVAEKYLSFYDKILNTCQKEQEKS